MGKTFAFTFRLDTNKPREARVKKYLDMKKYDGISKKEFLLKLLEEDMESNDIAIAMDADDFDDFELSKEDKAERPNIESIPPEFEVGQNVFAKDRNQEESLPLEEDRLGSNEPIRVEDSPKKSRIKVLRTDENIRTPDEDEWDEV